MLVSNLFRSKYLIPLNRSLSGGNNLIRKVRKINKDQLIWYPGHISKGINQMNLNLSKADIVIEIHDARIPFTGRTELMNTFGQVKPRILVFNKIDLIPKEKIQIIQKMMYEIEDKQNKPIKTFFTQINDIGKQPKLLSNILETIIQFVTNDSPTRTKLDHFVLIGGLPNVGKSTFINALRNWSQRTLGFIKQRGKKPAKVGAHAGVTLTVSEKILLSDGPPRIYMLDSPGVWEPSKENLETVLKLALCGCLNFNSLFKEHIIDYMLYWLNAHGEHEYVRRYEMPGPIDDVLIMLQHVCKIHGFIHRRRDDGSIYPTIESAIDAVFRDFSTGALGQVVLDDLDEVKWNRSIKESEARFAPLGSIISNQRIKHDFPFVWQTTKTNEKE